MRDRISTKILDNGAARYGVYDEDGNLLRYEYIKLEDEPDEEGTVLNKANLLTDETAAALGLTSDDPTVDEAFSQISTPQAGTGTLYVHCKDEAGEPVSGCVVQIGEEMAVTGASGVVKYFLAPGPYSVSIRSPIDYGAAVQTKSVTVVLSETVAIDATIQDSLNGATEVRLTSSVANAAFSGRVTSADVFGVGGGGSGGFAYHYDHGTAATGGAGGHTGQALDIDISKLLVLTVGAGGNPVGISSANSGSKTGLSGGATTVVTADGDTLLSVPGGSGGNYSSKDYPNCTGASGGSGSGGAYGYQSSGSLNGPYVGDSGEDGADGSYSGWPNNTTNGVGGIGQGSTTRLWGDPAGELFASAGASVVCVSVSASYEAGQPGSGGGPAFTGSTISSAGVYAAGDATTPGSGGGAFAIRVSSKTSITASSGAGMSGLLVFRWEVAV